MYRQEVIMLPLPPIVREKLLVKGFRTVGELEGIDAQQLAKETGLTQREAENVLKVGVSRERLGAFGARSAKELLDKELQSRRIVTACSELDSILGGGVATGQVTEFCGVPGVGKTQLGIQLAINVQLPEALNGCGGAAVFIDTEGSFVAERAVEMAESAVHSVHEAASQIQNPHVASQVSNFTVDSILSNIHYFRVLDSTKQLAVIQNLNTFLRQVPQVRLIVVDSVCFHFRHEFDDMALRAKILAQMAQDLMQLAESHDVAVVFVNQVTTKVLNDGNSKLIPALGNSFDIYKAPVPRDTWAHCASTRVILYWESDQRHAFVHKSPYMPSASAPYNVTGDGIR